MSLARGCGVLMAHASRRWTAARLANLVWYSASAMFEGKTPDVWLEPRSLLGPVRAAEQEIGGVTKTWKLT